MHMSTAFIRYVYLSLCMCVRVFALRWCFRFFFFAHLTFRVYILVLFVAFVYAACRGENKRNSQMKISEARKKYV